MDGLLKINQTAYNYLQDAGNPNLKFVTFNGGHEYLEENVLNMYLWMKQFVRTDLPTGLIPAGETSNRSRDKLYPESGFLSFEHCILRKRQFPG